MRLIVRGQLSERQLHKTSISFSRINSWTKQSTQNWHTQRKPKTKSIDRQFAWTIMPDREIKRGNGTQEHLRPPAEAGETSTVSSGTRYAKVRRSRSILDAPYDLCPDTYALCTRAFNAATRCPPERRIILRKRKFSAARSTTPRDWKKI